MNNSNRILVFLLGLSLGLLVGASFFIFKIDTYISQLTIFKNSKDTIIAVTQTIKDPANNGSAGRVKPAKIALQVVNNDSSLQNSAKQLQAAAKSDSLNDPPDSTFQEDEVIVRTDELIAAKTVELRNLPGTDKLSNKKTDSLLQTLSGIRDDSKQVITNYRIEFWHSPLNYKGFKMTKSRLLLFGINAYDDIKLYKFDDIIYLKHLQEIYKLDYTGDFKHFESIRDPQLVLKIKQDNLSLQQQ